MRNRILIVLALIGIALMIPPRWYGGLLTGPPDARCLGCRRDFHAPEGLVVCGRCRCIYDARCARELFTAVPGVPRLEYPTEHLVGPVPENATLVP